MSNITYSGYTVEEIREMEEDGSCPSHVLIQYVNGDHDGSDDIEIDDN